MLALALINIGVAAKCPSYKTCQEWNCKTWCACFDEKVEAKGLYAKAGCADDGPACDCDASSKNICYSAYFSKVYHDTRQCAEVYGFYGYTRSRKLYEDVDIFRVGSMNSKELGSFWSGYAEGRHRYTNLKLEMRMLAWWFDSDDEGTYTDHDRHELDMEHLLGKYRGHTGCVETNCKVGAGTRCKRSIKKRERVAGYAERKDRNPNSRLYVEMDAWEDDFGIRTTGYSKKSGHWSTKTTVYGAASKAHRDAQKMLNCKHNDWHSMWASTRDNTRDFYTDDCRVSDKHRFRDLGKIVDKPNHHVYTAKNKGHGVKLTVDWRYC